MIAKIGKGSNMYGAILYNQQKVDNENGAVLLLNKIPDTVDGRYSVAYFNKCFEPYLSANIKTENRLVKQEENRRTTLRSIGIPLT